MDAALTKVEITKTEGAIASVDGYTHWSVGSSAEENTIPLQRKSSLGHSNGRPRRGHPSMRRRHL